MEFNVADLFESVARVIPDREAVVTPARRSTFRELDLRANRLANALREAGVGPGDHVGLHLFNCAEFLEGILAAFKIRAVAINLNYRYVARELAYVLKNGAVKVLIHHRELTPIVQAARAEVPSLERVISIDDGSGVALDSGSVDYEATLDRATPDGEFEPRSGDDLYIIYTGGTTGMPRGVMWRHEDVFFAGLQGGNPGGDPIDRPEALAKIAHSQDRAMNVLPAAPFAHGGAQWAALIALFSGGKVVLGPSRHFDAEAIWSLVSKEKVTVLKIIGDAMATPLAEALERRTGAFDLSSLIALPSAGAVLSAAVKERLQAQLPGALIMNHFGATETGHQGASVDGMSGSTGRPAYYMDETNTVLGEDLRPVAPGSGVVGRLARSGRIPLGYYRDPEKTAAHFVIIDGVRWVLPGDLAMIEPDGLITVLGRGATCINSGGQKIFPEEVEEVVKSHPAVLDATVVGVPDERWGERVGAVVATRPGCSITLEGLAAHCRERLAGYKVPRFMAEVAWVQRLETGKPDFNWARQALQRALPAERKGA